MDWAFIGPIMLGLRGDWSTALRTRRERRELRSAQQRKTDRQAEQGKTKDKLTPFWTALLTEQN